MAIITIARELAAFGEEIAGELNRITGYKLVDRECIEKRLEEFGLRLDECRKCDEKKPRFWASFSRERDDYLHYLKFALFEEAAHGDCIVLGRGGSAIFKGVSNHLAVRITAPRALRVEKAMRQYSCNERRALQIIEESDHDRVGFHKFFFSLNWHDPREYDLTINMSRNEVEQAAETIDTLRTLLIDADKEAAGQRRLADLLLGQRVITEIVYTNGIPIHSLEVAVEGGIAQLYGVADAQTAIGKAIAAARAVPGISEAESSIHLINEYMVTPGQYF
jgi:cytidylate kinase